MSFTPERMRAAQLPCRAVRNATSRASAAFYLMLTNMPQAAESAAPVKTTPGLSQNRLP